ncbi:MAG: arginine--tRNA ligase [Chloroflexi bacterium]|jgi:arginyl-tRNA synthetase|nr:arginine--tRNA ligase [Chloroflexota bacterium]MBT3669873.1 arginine--tRNA ligase [Chloroflexota bacterium]MBT4001706.1 arginine--tRNA ligase [Chloroflexota bacterium]MBT4304775.1 arginine--tRNA ligase [Chloroflexota bacterium]MBT4534724.1 arginine--tRNA ligase [Chloroflexota bacterium]
MFIEEQDNIEKEINKFLEINKIPQIEKMKWNAIPFSGEWGISTSFFEIAALEARSGKKVVVPVRAQKIAEQAAEFLGEPKGISRIEAVKGYINLFFKTDEFSRRVIDTVNDLGVNYGRGESKNQKLMIEFSQPNTHKAMHVGHLRSMMLGDALAHILEFAGYEVIRSNYFGDYGRNVIKWIWNYKKFHNDEDPPKTDVTRWMGDLYAESNKNLEEDPNGEKEIIEMFSKWEARDPDIYGLWEKTRNWSLEGFNEIYDLMGIKFDQLYFESDMEIQAKEIVEKVIEMGIATDERPDGNTVAVKLDELLKLEKDTYHVLVLMRSDGTALYGAWDLALAQKKFVDYDLDKSIYVVDVRQSLHFKQVFKTLELAGWDKTDKVFHLPYEIVNLPGNVTVSSREGTMVLLEDLIREANQRALEETLTHNPGLPTDAQQDTARKIAIGAIKYPLLARDNTKIATFDWELALDFNGHAAPYIQYAYVRANSLLKKMELDLPKSHLPTYPLEEKEIKLIEMISQFPATVQKAADEYRTLQITNAAFYLAKTFNEFYNTCQVLKADPEMRDFRLRLVSAAKTSIANSLRILGIPIPDVM